MEGSEAGGNDRRCGFVSSSIPCIWTASLSSMWWNVAVSRKSRREGGKGKERRSVCVDSIYGRTKAIVGG